MTASAFFVQELNQQSYHGHHSGKQFHGMMQMSDIYISTSNSGTGASLFGLPFLSNAGLFNGGNGNAAGGGGSNEGNSFFSGGNAVGDRSSRLPSMYSAAAMHNHSADTAPPPAAMSPMSATALLQKAAQMGSSSSNHPTASLLRSFGNPPSPPKAVPNRNLENPASYGVMFVGNENFQDLVHSFAHAGSSSAILESAAAGLNAFEIFDPSAANLRHAVSIGGADQLTRDFLGVGGRNQMARQQHGMALTPLDTETNAAPPPPPPPPPPPQSAQTFGMGGNFP